ncbi:MAG: 2-oxoglutarate and iron-dependent oxygenase domain-containing protein [Holophagaceae bacterium]
MTGAPTLPASPFLEGPEPAQARALREALETHGWARLSLPPGPARLAADALRQAEAFFARPEAEKARLAIEGSPHHRGWSVMHNERDWREQLHLGRERAALEGGADGMRLQGPNRWPTPDGGFRQAVGAHLEACAEIGAALMAALAPDFGIPPEVYDRDDGYVLLKLIAYHPQPEGGPPRRGVAAHVDFSLLTLVAQDGGGGLEVQSPEGVWTAVPPQPDTLVLHAGELLEALSGGRIRATPHRVTHRGARRARISLPMFVNPPLRAWIHPRPAPPRVAGGGHVHRVLTGTEGPFRFGEAEWGRKGLNRWCAACCDGA